MNVTSHAPSKLNPFPELRDQWADPVQRAEIIERLAERGVNFKELADAVISVGYRVNSKRGTQFRIWATSVLHDHLLNAVPSPSMFSATRKRGSAGMQLFVLTTNLVLYITERHFIIHKWICV